MSQWLVLKGDWSSWLSLRALAPPPPEGGREGATVGVSNGTTHTCLFPFPFLSLSFARPAFSSPEADGQSFPLFSPNGQVVSLPLSPLSLFYSSSACAEVCVVCLSSSQVAL